MLFSRLSLALSVFQPWNNSTWCIAGASPRFIRQFCICLRGLNSVNTARVYRSKGRQSFGTSTSLCMNRNVVGIVDKLIIIWVKSLTERKNESSLLIGRIAPLNYCPVIPCRILLRKIDSQAEGSTVSVGCVGMASDMDMSSLEWESQFVTLKFKRISACKEDITLLLREHVDEVIKFVENGFCQIAVQQEGFSLGVGGGDSLATNSIMLPIRGGSLLLGTGQRVILHRSPQRGADAVHYTDDSDGIRAAAPLRLSLTWCGIKMEAQKKHAFKAPRVRDHRSNERESALRQSLSLLGVDADELIKSEEYMGTSAYRCCQSFVCPRPSKLSAVDAEPLDKASERVAMQVAFLLRKLRADEADYLRNTDIALAEYERQGLKPFNIVLVLDNVRSAYNVGSIFRTADTTRAKEVITTGFTPQVNGPGGKKIRKTAFNSIDSVRSRHVESSLQAVKSLKSEGYKVFALETTSGAKNLFDLDLRAEDNVALVMGNEVMGVEVSVMDICDDVVEIPVYGLKNSLNVCSAATVAVYEVLRQMNRYDHPSLQAAVSPSYPNGIQGRRSVDHNSDGSQSCAAGDLVESYTKRMSEPEPKILESIRKIAAEKQPHAAHMLSDGILGGFLKLITRSIGARRVLELGTFIGYSSLCFADGGAHTIVTCDSDAQAAEEARHNIDQAGAADRVKVHIGPALEKMKELQAAGCDPFDLIFIDADKRKYREYYAHDGIIIVDNVLFKGMVPLIAASTETDCSDDSLSDDEGRSHTASENLSTDVKTIKRRKRIARALHEFNLHLKEDQRVEVLMLPIRDGISIIRRSEERS